MINYFRNTFLKTKILSNWRGEHVKTPYFSDLHYRRDVILQ